MLLKLATTSGMLVELLGAERRIEVEMACSRFVYVRLRWRILVGLYELGAFGSGTCSRVGIRHILRGAHLRGAAAEETWP